MPKWRTTSNWPEELRLYGQSGTGELVTMPHSGTHHKGRGRQPLPPLHPTSYATVITHLEISLSLPDPCKWQGKVQVRSSIVALATSLNDSLFLVWDKISGRQFLLNTGAEVSVHKPISALANGSTISTYGNHSIPLHFGSTKCEWCFTVANVSRPLLGADFLLAISLLVDLKGKRLVNWRPTVCPITLSSSFYPSPWCYFDLH